MRIRNKKIVDSDTGEYWVVDGSVRDGIVKLDTVRGDITSRGLRNAVVKFARGYENELAAKAIDEARKTESLAKRTARRLAKKHGIEVIDDSCYGDVEVWVEIPDQFINEHGEYDESRFCASERHCYSWSDTLKFVEYVIEEIKSEETL